MKTNYISWVDDLALILRGNAIYRRYDKHGHGYIEYQTAPARDWHRELQRKFVMHPAVLKALESDYAPYNWHLLVLEWPHVSETDSTRLAYTRDERAGINDRQTITTVGKYITRHFPTMPDHEVRNLHALYAAGDSCKFVFTMAEMLNALMQGPASCMRHSFNIRCADGTLRHPYQVYDPQYGWHMAVRMQNGDTVGRALCMDNGDHKYFVRSYRKTDGYSPADEQLEAWLQSQGYGKESHWGDEEIAYYEVGHGDILAPYIDGGIQTVILEDDHLVICNYGDYDCSNTSGIVGDGDGDRRTCDDCGDRFYEGDGYWVGIHEETEVCESCGSDNYTYAYSRRGHQYYIRNDDVVGVNGEYYDVDYLSDNNIVELEDGEYEEMDNAVCVNERWYHCDDEDIVYAEDAEQYVMREDCWQCAESNNWYTDDIEYVEVDGEKYHPDHAPEQETTDEE